MKIIFLITFTTLVAFVSGCIGIIMGGTEITNNLQVEVDRHFMDKKLATAYTAKIKIEYFDGRFKSLKLIPGTTTYVNPKQ